MLLIRPDHLGDVLMSSPAVELLRKGLPGAHLSMMVGPWAAEMAQRDPLLDEVLVCPFPGFTRGPKGSSLAPYRLLWGTARRLMRDGYDAALVLRFDHWWGAWLAAQARIPMRVGCGMRECAPFLTHAIPPPGRVHWTEQALRVVDRLLREWCPMDSSHDAGQGLVPCPPGPHPCPLPLGGGKLRTEDRGLRTEDGRGEGPRLRFPLGPGDERRGDELWRQLGLDAHGTVAAIHPGSGSRLKLWPEDRWISLGWILAGRGTRIVVTGSEVEAEKAARIAAAVPGGKSLAGRTDLASLAALFRKCHLVVGADSGPLHLAVAAGSPTVHLFGPTDPVVFGPWGDSRRHRVVSPVVRGAPCGRLDLQPPGRGSPPCMLSIALDVVAAECLQLLEKGREVTG